MQILANERITKLKVLILLKLLVCLNFYNKSVNGSQIMIYAAKHNRTYIHYICIEKVSQKQYLLEMKQAHFFKMYFHNVLYLPQIWGERSELYKCDCATKTKIFRG